MEIKWSAQAFTLSHRGQVLLYTDAETPMVYAGYGEEKVDMYRGNFKLEDHLIERKGLKLKSVTEKDGQLTLTLEDDFRIQVSETEGAVELRPEAGAENINRFWLKVQSDAEEHVYGLGEQMSYFDLKGRHFPIWTSEPGVGRDKTTYVTWRSDVENGGAGGDYYNTNFPEPTYVSSRRYYLHMDSTAYGDFDFREPGYHELQTWNVPGLIRFEGADDFMSLLEKLTAYLGRQPELPDWVYNGLIIGAQGGERSFDILEQSLAAGIKVAGLWCQDWCGKRVTSFGKRLQWDWHYHKEMYPELPKRIEELHKRGIKFLGYVNPYLVNDGELFKEGEKVGAFAKRSDGSTYLVDFGEFDCGVIDLTSPAAFEWFKNEVIKKYTIDIGIDGWMADFGEYLPTDDIVLANGVSPMIEHNHWPALWAKCNYEAVKESGKLGEIVYFMRAGAAGSQKYCTLLWAGDQSVDFSRHDGLCTVISAALSSGMSGCGLNHCDIGGYTSLFDNCRTKEVFLRWSEMAAFMPVMRTHEGNRPDTNFQYYDDPDCMKQLARLVDVYTMLAPYTKHFVAENAAKGIPVQRPLFLHYEEPRAYTEQFEYLYGSDLLVAPVWQADKTEWEVYLPEDEWVHLWTGTAFGGGVHTVAAPLGEIPVFYKKNSDWAELFESIRAKQGV